MIFLFYSAELSALSLKITTHTGMTASMLLHKQLWWCGVPAINFFFFFLMCLCSQQESDFVKYKGPAAFFQKKRRSFRFGKGGGVETKCGNSGIMGK